MRIAVLAPLESPWVREILLHLSWLGHQVHAVDFEHVSELPIHETRQRIPIADLRRVLCGVHLLSPWRVSALQALHGALQVRWLLADIKPDHLLTLSGGTAALIAYASRFRPYSVFAMGSDVLLIGRLKRALSRLTFHSAHAVLANGRHLASKAQEFAPSARCIPLLHGIDTQTFTPGIRKSTPVRIVCVRWFQQVYNNAYLIEGLATMRKIDTPFRVSFLSNGPLRRGVQALADRILPPEIRAMVEFVSPASHHENLEMLQSAHVYVSMSKSDGTSTALMEALGCGLFPVLSDIPANREWIDPEKGNGILVPLSEPQSLGDALVRTVESESLRADAVAYNRAQVVRRASINANLPLLMAVLAGPPPSGN